jgi:hypothetical protein
MTAPFQAGGLQLLLPGHNFKIMNQVIKNEDTKTGFEKYH